MVNARLLEILACPWCLGELKHGDDRLTCRKCSGVYRIKDDIPHMLVEEAELYCAACHTLMEKRGADAVCTRCGRHFGMDIRVQGSLMEHARRFCPRCEPEEIGLNIGDSECTCPRCGATYPMEG